MRKVALKTTLLSAATAALLAGAAMLALQPSQPAVAQAGALYVNAVDLDIAPEHMAKFLEAIKENGANSVKEPGCREFNIQLLASNPNHVFLYEVYDNEAALTAHRETAHFKKYAATVEAAKMVTGRNVRGMTVVALNVKAR